MQLALAFNKIEWWLWSITLALIVAALLGWEWGYALVPSISVVQVVYFWTRQKSLLAFDTQVRIVYCAFTFLGFLPAIRFPCYLVLFIGTAMVVLFDRCGIAVALKKMPWNRQPVVTIQQQGPR